MNISSFGRRILQVADGLTLNTISGIFSTANTWTAIQTFSANPLVSGGAISFPATQVPSAGANDLDDYEEGTFTPTFSATGATFSYATQSGRYTKIGNMAFYDVVLSLNTSGNTLTANPLSVAGMPFTSAAGFAGFVPVRFSGGTTSYVGVYVRATGTTLVFEGLTAAALNASALNSNALLHATNGSVIQIRGFYPV